jgi:hypothetical protein
LTLISTQAPNKEKHEAVKEEFYSSLEKVCNTVPNYDMQTILGDFNAKVGEKKSPIYIQHVEVTAFTTKQMTMGNKW